MLIIGVDQAGLIRKPIRCATGLVLIATTDPHDDRAVAWIERIGARYLVVLPHRCDFVVDKLLHPEGDAVTGQPGR